ncbi:MAG TPA: aspartate aminotransferase family protein, partial [Candidatus Bathyarchaeia archaeon]|nr:aspartate aminotransferase family protein [Candidatus Bathyarchaeia archaeon]
MTPLDTVKIEDEHLAQVYSKRPITITRGKGSTVYDANGREYVDCAGAYGTCIVGHSHPKVVEAIQRQASLLTSAHSSTYNDARALFIEKLISIAPSGLDRVFPANSGAEAVEAAIKIARKSTGRRNIVAAKGGYHGKTSGALSATWDQKYRKNFEPLLPGFSHVPYDDTEAVKSAITSDTAAILVEPVQGEGGVRVPSPGWLPALKDLARDNGSLLILDEIQSGFGRTGKMYAHEHFHATPDIMCLGKGLASGLPIGVTLASSNVMGALAKGEHTTTFGGNPLVSAAGAASIDALLEDHLLENAASTGLYFKENLEKLRSEFSIVRETRGLG